MMVLGGRCLYLSFCFLLTWHALRDFVNDRIEECMPFQYIVASLSLQVKCDLGAAGSGDTRILRTFGVALELSFYHPCTPHTCCQQDWLPVLCLVLHCAWSNVWVWRRPFVPLQSLELWGERSTLPCYDLQTLHLDCILVFHCLGCSCCNSAKVLRKPSILLWFPFLLVYQK